MKPVHNPLLANVTILFLLKTAGNCSISSIVGSFKMETFVKNGLKKNNEKKGGKYLTYFIPPVSFSTP